MGMLGEKVAEIIPGFFRGLEAATAAGERGFGAAGKNPLGWSGWFGALGKAKGFTGYLEPTAQFLGSAEGNVSKLARYGTVFGGGYFAANTALNAGSQVWKGIMPPYGFMKSNQPFNPIR